MSNECKDPEIWLDNSFWNRLSDLEALHQRARSEHEIARCALDMAGRDQIEELTRVWRIYCDVLAELDRTTAALEELRLAPAPALRSARAPARSTAGGNGVSRDSPGVAVAGDANPGVLGVPLAAAASG